MDPSWLAAVIIIVINIIGWAYTFGKLNGRVKSLEETADRHEKSINNGVVQEISECKTELANLAGIVRTYIDLTKEG